MTLTGDTVAESDVAHEGKVTYECADGYTANSGSGDRTCTAGSWDTPTLTCTGKSIMSTGTMEWVEP